MNAFKTTTIMLALGIAAGIGCGSDSGGGKTDAPVIVAGTGGTTGGLGGALGTGGAVGTGGALGMGGSVAVDAPAASGGSGGGMDGSPAPDAPLPGVDGNTAEATPASNLCTGLSAAACDQAIRNAPVDNTVMAQDVPVISATAYPACSQ